MRLLVLGGSVFLSRAVAEEAVRRGHDVTCACRGESGSVPEGARHVVLDRAAGSSLTALDDAGLAGQPFDAVVDVARTPSWVRAAVQALPDPHWVFVSTVNVYPDTSTPDGTPATLGLHEPLTTDEDPMSGPDAYGAMKVACEQLVQEGATSSTVIRPGLIAGPGDPSGRFSYWPERLARGGEVLAPGDPADVVQLIDARDLAAWIVTAAETRLDGVFDGVGPTLRRAELLAQVAAGVGVTPSLTWVDQGFLESQEVQPWSGPKSVPLWLPRPEYAGMLAHDPTPSYAADLTTRPIAETARDTLAWLRETPEAVRTGLTPAEEADVLEAWAART